MIWTFAAKDTKVLHCQRRPCGLVRSFRHTEEEAAIPSANLVSEEARLWLALSCADSAQYSPHNSSCTSAIGPLDINTYM